jgi:hypothetical protein
MDENILHKLLGRLAASDANRTPWMNGRLKPATSGVPRRSRSAPKQISLDQFHRRFKERERND